MSDTEAVGLDVLRDREDEKFIASFMKDAPKDAPKEPKAAPKEAKAEVKEVVAEEVPDDEAPAGDEPEHPDEESDSGDVADDLTDAEPEEVAEESDAGETKSVPVTDAAQEFADALDEQGVSLTLDDIPEAHRPIVEKKIKDLVAGFTRARTADREQFKDTIQLRAEMRLLKERPADVIVERILRDPALAEAINAKLDQLDKMDQLDGKPGTSALAHQETVKRARESAVTAEESHAKQADTEARRIDAITAAGMRAAKAAGVPFQAGVEDAIAAQLALGHIDITMAEITKIAQEKAAVWERSTRAVRREATKGYVKRKVADRETGGLQIKPGSGTAAAPGAKAGPKNDDEFTAEFAGRI